MDSAHGPCVCHLRARMWLPLEKREEHVTNQKASVLGIVLSPVCSVTLERESLRVSKLVSPFSKGKEH